MTEKLGKPPCPRSIIPQVALLFHLWKPSQKRKSDIVKNDISNESEGLVNYLYFSKKKPTCYLLETKTQNTALQKIRLITSDP